ncbi:M15 family metallopeptidase [Georgenia yuyongxinii]
MDGIVAITQRIAGIQAQLSALAASPPRPAVGAAGAFDQVLGRAATEFSPAAGTASGLTVDGVPADLAAYGNGRIPATALAPVGSAGHKLWAPAAEAFEQLLEAATAQGVKIGITDSYRSFEIQEDVVRRKGLYSEGGLGARPGTSPHGWGMAVDLDLDPAGQAWMRANASRFGFVEDTPREPWHWGFRPSA